jgi:hypothetical protein
MSEASPLRKEPPPTFSVDKIVNLLRTLEPAAKYWTLNGSGAMAYYLGHRQVNELDFFIERAAKDKGLIPATRKALMPLMPEPFLSKAIDEMSSVETGSYKIFFEKVTFSFIFAPNSRCKNRLFLPNALPIASFKDTLGSKYGGLNAREKLNDYIDLAEAIRRGTTAAQLIEAFESMRNHEVDYRVGFSKMISPSTNIAARLSLEQLEFLRKTGNDGMDLLSSYFIENLLQSIQQET